MPQPRVPLIREMRFPAGCGSAAIPMTLAPRVRPHQRPALWRGDWPTMARHVLSVRYMDVLPMLGLALVFLWFRLARVSVREVCAHAALTVTGYLRPRPDPALERALRTAFADLDRDLAAILGDRTPRDLPIPPETR